MGVGGDFCRREAPELYHTDRATPTENSYRRISGEVWFSLARTEKDARKLFGSAGTRASGDADRLGAMGLDDRLVGQNPRDVVGHHDDALVREERDVVRDPVVG